MASQPSFLRRPWLWSLLFLLGLFITGTWLITSDRSDSGHLSGKPQASTKAPETSPEDPIQPEKSWLDAATPAPRSPVETALADLLAGRPFAMVEHGRQIRFQLALDELYHPKAPVPDRLQKIPARPDADSLISLARSEAQKTGQWPGLVIYPEQGPKDEAHRRVLTEEIVIRSADLHAAEQAAGASGLKVTSRPAYSKTHLITAANSPLDALDALAALKSQTVIASAEPLLLKQFKPRAVPNDTFFSHQWHLKNTGQAGGKAGVDIGVENVWDTYQGEGIRIAIVDDGLQINHPDLLENVDTANHRDWNGSDTDPSPDTGSNYHGTAVAGVAAARGNNNLGVSGVAPKATLVGFRVLGGMVSDAYFAGSASEGSDIIQIKNNSWGPPDGYPSELGASSSLMDEAMETAARTGRGGLGTISVWAAGNGRSYGDQGNKDGYSNNIHGIAVGAVSNKGVLLPYSETGSHLCVSAPSGSSVRGITTTDLKGVAGYNNGLDLKNLYEVDYTNDFNGTSASAPIVSGVVALMLQANPNLNWRDVKEILLRSSTKISPTDKLWVQRDGGGDFPSLPPIKHSPYYGGGLINARAAVEMARTWTSLGEMVSATVSKTPPQSQSNTPGTRGTTIIIEPDPKKIVTRLDMDFSTSTAIRVEHVAVEFNASHARRGDLTIQLVSPSGTVSTLAGQSRYDVGADYTGWTFTSVRHWGESSRGVWSVIASEADDDIDGTIGTATITLYGSAYPAIELLTDPPSQLVAEGSSTAFTASTTTSGKTSWQWLKEGKAIPGATTGTINFPSAKFSDAAIYTFTAQNLTHKLSTLAALGVVRLAVAPQQVLAGRTATFKVAAASPKYNSVPLLRYKWFVGSRPLDDDGRITGTETATLTIRNVGIADAEDYSCRVSLLDAPPLFTQRATLGITIPPTLENFLPPDAAMVSGYIDYQVVAEHGATTYSAKGLPPGLKLDAKTGRITGRITKPGFYSVTFTVSNAAGSNKTTINWAVEDLPQKVVGTHRGLLERSLQYNNNYGGSFLLTVTNTGTFTGTLTRGKEIHRFKGALDTYPGETYTTANVGLPRTGATALDLTFTLDAGQLQGSLSVGEEDGAALWAALESTSLPVSLAQLPGVYNIPLVPQNALSSVPRGSGYLSATLSTKGRLTYTGRLADGTTLTGGAGLGEGYLLPLHHMLYSNTGSVQGTLTLNTALGNITAAVDWFKSVQPPTSTTRSHRNGFAQHALNGTGGRYVAPLGDALVMNLPFTTNNTRLSYSEGGLFQPFSLLFTLAAKNVPLLPVGLDNPRQLKLSVNAKTGLVTGSGTAMDIDPLNPALNRQRPGTYNGLIISNLNRAEGHFLLPENQLTTSAILSGRFSMQPASAP